MHFYDDILVRVARLWKAPVSPIRWRKFYGEGVEFHGGKTPGTPVGWMSLRRCGRAWPPAASRARKSANGRQLRVGARRTNEQVNEETDGHRHRL